MTRGAPAKALLGDGPQIECTVCKVGRPRGSCPPSAPGPLPSWDLACSPNSRPREAERPTPGLRGERGRENFLYSSTLPATERVGPTPESPGSPGQGNRMLNYEASVAENTPSLWRGLPRRMNFKICQQGITKALGAKSYSC